MPGLPMFGHGQIEGFEEKYGMEYRRAYRDEFPDGFLVGRHEYEIFPLMKRRALFSGSEQFRLYDLYCDGGSVNENVFAYSNRAWINGREEKALIFFNNSYYETSGWINVSDPEVPRDGGVRRDKLSEALAIHGESQYFTLLREQKSNLWYVRSSKAISENGFFVGLKGYETQVFLDVYEVEDDVKGRWARLNNDLNGSGVPDPYAAVKDIFLGELYFRFMEILKDDFIIDMKDSINKKSFIDSLREPVKTFIDTAKKFITGADGQWDSWNPVEPRDSIITNSSDNTKQSEAVAENEKSVSCKFTTVDTDTIWNEFESFISGLINIIDTLKKPQYCTAKDSGAVTSPLLSRINKCLSERQMLNAVALSYGVLGIFRSVIGKEAAGNHAVSLAFDHWDMGRKLRQFYTRFGASEAEAWRITDLVKAVLSRTNVLHTASMKNGSKFSPSEFAALIIDENYHNEDFRRILGINIYNDILWFNKEGFEDALFYSSLFFMMENSVKMPMDERIEKITGIYDVMTKAQAKADYRLDKLLDILTAKPVKKDQSDKKPTAKTPVKKAAVKKTKEEKAAPKKDVKKTEEKKTVKKKPGTKSKK